MLPTAPAGSSYCILGDTADTTGKRENKFHLLFFQGLYVKTAALAQRSAQGGENTGLG